MCGLRNSSIIYGRMICAGWRSIRLHQGNPMIQTQIVCLHTPSPKRVFLLSHYTSATGLSDEAPVAMHSRRIAGFAPFYFTVPENACNQRISGAQSA